MSIGVRFDLDIGHVEFADGNRVILTAAERRVLELLLANRGRLLTRNQILDAVSEPGSDKTDRNVDFLINRLRRKLSDDARNPRFIATRYGEGYVWIAPAQTSVGDLAYADVVFGPVLGLDRHPDPRLMERRAREICAALTGAFGTERRVVYAPDCPPAEAFDGKAPSYNAELAFFLEGDETICVVTLRHFRSGRAEAARRFRLVDVLTEADRLGREMHALVNQGWLSRVDQPLDREPLTVSMYTATVGRDANWKEDQNANNRALADQTIDHQMVSLRAVRENETRIRSLLDATPDNAELKLMLAVTHHSKYVLAGSQLFANGQDTREKDEDEIETLVTEALPYIRARPELVIVAGKLLHFLKRGYDDLGRDLCESAYSRSVSVASSLAIVGQMRAFFGETDAALQCLEQSLNYTKPGSHAYFYALIMKCQALAAAGDWEKLRSARKEMSGASKLVGFAMEPLFTDPRAPSVLARTATYLMTRNRAQGVMMHAHYVGSRLFSDPLHGQRMLSCFASVATRRFGNDIIPDEPAQAFPGLQTYLEELRK